MAANGYPSLEEQVKKAARYIEIGDYYTDRFKYDTAAVAYQKAVELSYRYLSREDQLYLAQRLLSVRRMDLAIAHLRQLRFRQKDNVEARILLAKCLAWNNQPTEAVEVIDEALELAPDNAEAKLVKATASSWRGDMATAVPMFEALAKSQNNFELALSYAYSLANSGNRVLAEESLHRLESDDVFRMSALDDLELTLMRNYAPNALYSYEYFEDSYRNRHAEQQIRFEFPVGNAKLFLLGSDTTVADDFGYQFGLTGVEAGLKHRLGDAGQVELSLGLSRYDDFDVNDVSVARLSLDHRFSDVKIAIDLSHEAYDDFTYIIYNQIELTKSLLTFNYQPSDFWQIDLEYLDTRYSDDNASEQLSLAYRYALYHKVPRISVGLQYETLAFERQTDHGYFDPDQQSAYKLLFQIYAGANRIEAGLELFAGRQNAERLGYEQDDGIVGWEGLFRYHWLKSFYIEAEWEGGNYGIDQIYLYRYNTVAARAMFMF